MKSKDDIKKSIKVARKFIENHKAQIKYYMEDDFDIDKIEEYSRKIKLLNVEISALEWVLNEN